MATDIAIKNLQTVMMIRPQKMTASIKKVLRSQGVKKARLSFALVDDQKIKSLNRKYLQKNSPTDVLAFDLKSSSVKSKKELNGEIIISAQTVLRNAKSFDNAPQKELLLCVIHGILHLIGFDDHKPKDIALMRKEEKRILKMLDEKHYSARS